jgi:DNA modification methylase
MIVLIRPESIYDKILLGDCETVLKNIPSNSVQLTITSPPYGNAIDYDLHVAKKNQENYRGVTKVKLDEYIDNLVSIFNEQVFRVTKEGGYCCIVIANEVVNGTLIPLPHLLLSKLVEPFGKWNLHEEIIWHKVTGGTNRYGSFVINPYPKYYRANIMHEFILVLRKGDVKSGRDRKREILPATHEEWTKEIANSVWHIAPVPPGYINHPCPFPEEIPYRLMKIYSYKNDIILDPFNGSGQTTKIAYNLNRHFVGIDIKQEYVSLAFDRLANEPLHIRQEALIANWRKIASHACVPINKPLKKS